MLTTAFFLSGCLPDPLDVEGIPKVQPRIVVSSQILAGRGVVILLTKTLGALDASDDSDPRDLLNQIAVNDALVTIESDSRVDTLEFIESGVYSRNINLEPGKMYRLSVNSAALGKVSAVAEVKQQVFFKTIDASISNNDFDTLATISYSFNDLAGPNWYMVNAQRITLRNIPETALNPWFTSLLIEEKDITSPVYRDTLTLFSRHFSAGDTLMVSLSNVSQEYFNFLKLRSDARFSVVDFLGEPVNYPSNVEGGYGFFNLYLPDVRMYVVWE